jgi:hypothetical protein
MNEQYLYSIAGNQNGPVTLEDLRTLAVEGKLKRTDRIWRKGMPSRKKDEAISEPFEGVPPDLPTNSGTAQRLAFSTVKSE